MPFNPRKRECSDQNQLLFNEASRPVLKKQKIDYPDKDRRPAEFWDGLSSIPLTKAALEEFDCRNAKVLLSSTCEASKRFSRPITRGKVATWRSEHRLREPVSQPSGEERRFARRGGPDLTDLRGFQISIKTLHCTMSSSQGSYRSRSHGTKPTTNTASTKSTRAYDRAFQQNLTDGGIYPHGYRYPDGLNPPKPENWTEIQEKLARPRASLSPSKFSDEAYEVFVQADADAFKEKQVTSSVIPIIEGRIQDSRCVAGGVPFNNLAHLTDGTLAPGNPDLYYGARPEQLSRQVRDALNDLIVPSTQHDLPILPNFSLAAKGPDGSLAVAGRQACYDGALGARSMHALQAYVKNEKAEDGHAYTITSIYHGGQLKMYTSHRVPLRETVDYPEYTMTQINTWGMTGNPDTFRQGATAFRNAREWAKEERDDAISKANSKARALVDIPTSNVSASNISSTSLVSTFSTQVEAYNASTQEETLPSFVQGNCSTVDGIEIAEDSQDKVNSNCSMPLKRSGRPLRRTTSQRKRSKTQGSTGSSRGPPFTPTSQPPTDKSRRRLRSHNAR